MKPYSSSSMPKPGQASCDDFSRIAMESGLQMKSHGPSAPPERGDSTQAVFASAVVIRQPLGRVSLMPLNDTLWPVGFGFFRVGAGVTLTVVAATGVTGAGGREVGGAVAAAGMERSDPDAAMMAVMAIEVTAAAVATYAWIQDGRDPRAGPPGAAPGSGQSGASCRGSTQVRWMSEVTSSWRC